jgi:hypothetical protein
MLQHVTSTPFLMKLTNVHIYPHCNSHTTTNLPVSLLLSMLLSNCQCKPVNLSLNLVNQSIYLPKPLNHMHNNKMFITKLLIHQLYVLCQPSINQVPTILPASASTMYSSTTTTHPTMTHQSIPITINYMSQHVHQSCTIVQVNHQNFSSNTPHCP